MPGVNPLVAELGVGHKTVKAALRMLENEGILVNQGRGAQRKIVLPEDHAPPGLRVAILFYEKGCIPWGHVFSVFLSSACSQRVMDSRRTVKRVKSPVNFVTKKRFNL